MAPLLVVATLLKSWFWEQPTVGPSATAAHNVEQAFGAHAEVAAVLCCSMLADLLLCCLVKQLLM